MLLRIIKVSGRSLYPVYCDGDFVIVSKIPILIAGFRPGDVIVFDHPVHHQMIKKIERVEAGGKSLFVLGENDDSIDSRRFGTIPSDWVKAKVIAHIRRR